MIMDKLKSGGICPKIGDWWQKETGEVMPYTKGDEFPNYYKKVGESDNGAPFYSITSKKADYVYVD